MQATPDLEPKTKEIWAGIRSAASASSAIQDEVNRIRSRLSGLTSYKEFLESSTSFDDWQSDLEAEANACGTLTPDDVAGTIVDPVESNFASWADYKGSKSNSTGVYAQATYDGYRTYLTNNGLTSVNADQHIQAVQSLFSSDTTFLDRISEFDSYSALDTWLTNNGWTDSEAQALIDDLKAKYTWTELETAVQGACSLAQLLNKFDHDEGTGGDSVVGTETDDSGVLYLRGTEIRMQQIGSDQSEGTAGGSVSWTLSTTSQTITAGDTLAIEADGSSSETDFFKTGVGLVIDGEVAEKKSVAVFEGVTSVSFSHTFESAAERLVSIGDSGSITITVQPA